MDATKYLEEISRLQNIVQEQNFLIQCMKNCANCKHGYDSGMRWFCCQHASSQSPWKADTAADHSCQDWSPKE